MGLATRTRATAFAVLLPLVLIAARGRADAIPYTVADSVFQIASTTEGPALEALRLRFDLPVLEAVYDSASRIVVVRLARHERIPTRSIVEMGEPTELETLLAWDLAKRKVLWSRSTTSTLRFAVERVVVLGGDTDFEVLDLYTGKSRQQFRGRVWFLPETRQLLHIDNDRARGLTLPSLGPDWEAEVDGPAKDTDVASDGTQLFLLARKLTTVDLLTGQSWMVDTPLRRPTTLAARFIVLRWEVTGLEATPVRSGDDLFFAADSVAMNLHAHTGIARWRRTLDFDPREKARRTAMGMPVLSQRSPGLMRLGPGADDVAIVSSGFAYVNGAPAWADPPAIGLFDRATGRWLRGSRIQGAKRVTSYVRNAQGHILLCDGERLTRYDALLQARENWIPDRRARPLRRVVELDEALIAFTATDAVELDPVQLREVRSFRLGAKSDRLARPGWCAGTEALLRIGAGIRSRYPRRALQWNAVDGVEVSADGPEATVIWLDPDGPGPNRE
jgi:hypothetical protein